MFEKRKHPREAIDLEATVTVEGSDEVLVGRIRDLSIGGTFFIGAGTLAFGTMVQLAISFPPPSGTIMFPAVVRWKAEDGFGVQFGLVGARETHAIAKVLSKR